MMRNKTEKYPLKSGLKYWIRLISMGLVGGFFIAFIVIEMIFIMAITQPAPSVIGSPPQNNNDIEYQSVALLSELEGITLSGWYIPSENGAAIILLHGYGGNRLEMISRADILVRHGYGVLLYDLRGHGESGGEQRAFGWQDVKDVKAALEFLSRTENVNPDRIGILGFSIGGQIAIRATAEYEEIKAIIADDPSFVTIDDAPRPLNIKEKTTYLASWITSRCVSLWTGIHIPVGIPEKIKEISPRPIMLIVTGETRGRDLVRYFYQIAYQPKELWEIPETYHGGQLKTRPLEYEDKMITFFNNNLLKK
jgi:pimeloyl-ACP methyl ester carboxylesterase